MASYNDYDGEPIIASHYWLTQKLRQEFGFKGYVVSDSESMEYLFSKHGVSKDREEATAMAVNAGLNVRTNFSPPQTMIVPLRKAIKNGKVSVEIINERVAAILKVKFTIGLFNKPFITDAMSSLNILNNPEHKKKALQASLESIVLLKNEGDILPLSKNIKSIAVIGPNADYEGYCHGRYGPKGVTGITVLDGIRQKSGNKVSVKYAKGCEIADKNWPESEVFPSIPTAFEIQQMEDAVKIAKECDVTVMVMGGSLQTAGESKSRTDLNLTGYQDLLIRKIQETGKKVIVVLINSQPITCNWVSKNIAGIVEAWYPGQFGGQAIADVLFGDYNPGGKLSITFPRSVGQLPMNFPSKPNAQTDNGDEARLKGSLFPLGFGLSYTTFHYSNLNITPQKQGLNAKFKVSFDVTNTGQRQGDEIVQLYTYQKFTKLTTYEKNLCGFERINLMPNETKRVLFELTPNELASVNINCQWEVEPGTVNVMVGASSEDVRLKSSFELVK